MDASDITKQRKAKTIYINQLNAYIAANPGGDCGKLSTCTTGYTSSCTHYFPSYDNKYTFFEGKNLCQNCTCPIAGGSE